MNEFFQDSVSATVWPWMKPTENIASGGRRRFVIQGMALLVVAGVLYFWLYWRATAAMVTLIGTFFLVSGALAPCMARKLEAGLRWVGQSVGLVLTWIVLALLFYTVFLAGNLWLRWRRKDLLEIKQGTGQATYWKPRPVPHPDQIRKQY